jgi:hypothetical protein
MGGRTLAPKEENPHMPYVIPSGRKILAALAVVAGVLTAGAPAASAATSSSVCVTPEFSQVFSQWRDNALYTLSPGGSFETALSGWTLSGGAKAVAGNESFFVGSSRDRMSLSLPAGASAVSAPMCIDRAYPSFRFFARNAGTTTTGLDVQVNWKESGVTRTTKVKLDKQIGSEWAPVKSVQLPAGALGTDSLEPVTFTFTAAQGAAFQIDDLYVDPYMRR